MCVSAADKSKLNEITFFMRQLIFTALFCTTILTAGTAQTIRFKTDYNDVASSKLKFKTVSFSGSLKATNAELFLIVKNNSSTSWEISQCQLSEVSGKGDRLCLASVAIIAVGERAKLVFRPCRGDGGVFRLKDSYPSKTAFREDAFFLREKEWTLTIGGESFTFYTDL